MVAIGIRTVEVAVGADTPAPIYSLGIDTRDGVVALSDHFPERERKKRQKEILGDPNRVAGTGLRVLSAGKEAWKERCRSRAKRNIIGLARTRRGSPGARRREEFAT